MTLVAAVRRGENIHVFSDSRLTFEKNQTVDFGIKLLSVPIRIESAIDSLTGRGSEIFSGAYGMAFAGSALSANLTKELLADMLCRLQPLPEVPPPFESICEALRGFAETIGRELCQYLRDSGLIEFLLLGHSAETGRLAAARFELCPGGDGVCCQCRPVLESEDQVELLGKSDGKDAFNRFLGATSPSPSAILAAMDAVIADKSLPGVGGDVQYGRFEGAHFRVFGIVRERMEGSSLLIEYRLRGFDLNKELDRLHDIGMHPRYPFINGPSLPDDVIDREIRKYIFKLS